MESIRVEGKRKIKHFSTRLITILSVLVSASTGQMPSFRAEEVNQLMKPVLCSMGLDTRDCPVDGMWTSWGKWEDCSGICGQTGLRRRYRSCTNPGPKNNGQQCPGPGSESKLCHLPGCRLADYESSSKCNEFQNDQYQVLEKIHSEHSTLIRNCIEADCTYRTVEELLGDKADSYWNALFCVKHSTGCPEMGGWSSWSVYSDCTADCGQGEHVQCRTCTDPVPVSGKYACRGENCSFSPCSGTKCDNLMSGTWSRWSSWLPCSATCGQGLRKRTRHCIQNDVKMATPRFSSKSDSYLNYAYMRSKRRINPILPSRDVCIGQFMDLKTCYANDCPIDGEWSEWVPWSPCSSDCGIGLQSRSRACSRPPPLNGGDACFGPVTWIRHCFNAPCLDVVHSAVYFRGDGFLDYTETGKSSRLLQIYVKFKTWTKDGEIVRRWANSNDYSRKPSIVKLYLNYGYLMLRIEVGECRLVLASYGPIQVGSWVKVIISVTGSGATMRIDDSDSQYRNSFPPKCWANDPEFDGEMNIGRNFVGEISKMTVNFIPVSLRVINSSRPLDSLRNSAISDEVISPFFAFNSFNTVSVEDRTFSLDNRIMAPCFENNSSWSVRLVVKTEAHDGVVLIIIDEDGSQMTLEFEPYRISVRYSASDQCSTTVHQLVEHHVGRWILVDIDKDEGSPIGLAVNGGLRKAMLNDGRNGPTCSGQIVIGGVDDYLGEMVCQGQVVRRHERSMKGQIAYLSVDGTEIELSSLPSESPSTKIKSSEAISISRNYVEYVLEDGQPLELRCLHTWNSTMKQCGRNSQKSPLWLYSAIPIEPQKKMSWGGVYSNDSYATHSVLNADNYAKDTIDGFYSCWLPNSENNSSIIITFGVTVRLLPREDVVSVGLVLIGNGLFCMYLVAIAISGAATVFLYAAIIYWKYAPPHTPTETQKVILRTWHRHNVSYS